MLGYSWIRNFTITPDDVEYLTSHLLETETPLTTEALAILLIDKRLQADRQAMAERYRDVTTYNPAETYTAGQRLMFSKLDFATGVVQSVRTGENAQYGDFAVVTVQFDDAAHNPAGTTLREFACHLSIEHPLNSHLAESPAQIDPTITAEQLLDSNYREIITTLQAALQKGKELMRIAGYWFPRELVLEVDIGTSGRGGSGYGEWRSFADAGHCGANWRYRECAVKVANLFVKCRHEQG
jgi:hypothetical protein